MPLSFLLTLSGLLLSAAPIKAEALDAAASELQKKLHAIYPAISVKSVRPSAVPGFEEVELDHLERVYVDSSHRYVFVGPLLDLSLPADRANVTATKQKNDRKMALALAKRSQFLTFRANAPKQQIYVFTDVSCGYCRQFHEQVPALNQAGVTVHYIAFPRAGAQSNAAHEMQTIWCSAHPQDSYTTWIHEQKLPKKSTASCEPSIKAQYELARSIGIQGTPNILLEDGTLIPGYRPVEALLDALKH